MGAGASGLADDTPGGALRLPASGLRVPLKQLTALNRHVDELYEEDRKERMSLSEESHVQSVVQRLVDGAGQRDPRYRCGHLVALHQGRAMRSRSLEYLVTLDSLPPLNVEEECALHEGPAGYGRVRLGERSAELWQEFLTPQGYLCRDKVLERWVQLLARCGGARGRGGCRVLGALAAQRAEPYHYCYLERASPPQSAPDRRLAIVQGAAWVLVRCGPGPGEGRGEAKLMLGLRVGGASGAAYTGRVPLTHPMALLHYTAGMQSYYAVAAPPPAAPRPPRAAWQLWHPALEAALDRHAGDTSPLARVAGALNALMHRMRDGYYQGSLPRLSRYAAWCALRRRADRCGAYPHAAARYIVSSHMAHHLLMVLDSLYSLCERGGVAGYVYRVERDCVVRRGEVGGQWEEDAACLRNCLLQLVQIAGEDIPPSPSESLETALLGRWERLLGEGQGAGGAGAAGYSRGQLRYLWRAAQQLLAYKDLIPGPLPSTTDPSPPSPPERQVRLLGVMLDQARDLYLSALHSPSYGHFDRDTFNYRCKKWLKLQQHYDLSAACLVEAARRDPALGGALGGAGLADGPDGPDAIKQVLSWLQRGAKEDSRWLSGVLRPYLAGLRRAALEGAWLLDHFDASKGDDEFQGLKEFCVRVHWDQAAPCAALLEAARQYSWPKALVDVLDRYKHIEFRLVLPTGAGLAVSHPARLPPRRHRSRALTLTRGDKAQAKLRLAQRCVLRAFALALAGDADAGQKPHISRQSSEEILVSAKSGNYWRLSRPDLIPAASFGSVSSRGSRAATACGFPELCVTSQSDPATLRRKYHTVRSLVHREPAEALRGLRRPRSAGGSGRDTRPSLMETLDFINSVKDALCVEESGMSDTEECGWSVEDEQLVGRLAPLNVAAGAGAGRAGGHWALGGLVPSLLTAGKFSVLQELCPHLGEASEGVLFALHRLARAARSKSSDRAMSSWRLPELEGAPPAPPQRYRPRPSGSPSEDEQPPPPPPQPPPLPRRSSRDKMTKRFPDYTPPKRLQELEQHLEYLEKVSSRLNLSQNQPKPLNHSYTGIINPIYDIKMPKDKFSVKRSKSLGRSFSTKSLGLEITRYNITLGRHSGKQTNDVITALSGMTGQTAVEGKTSYFQRNADSVVGDSYKVSRVTID